MFRFALQYRDPNTGRFVQVPYMTAHAASTAATLMHRTGTLSAVVLGLTPAAVAELGTRR